jgi:hypothetical protein
MRAAMRASDVWYKGHLRCHDETEVDYRGYAHAG